MKKCTLIFDEMELKLDVEFSKVGRVKRFEEFGSTTRPAKRVLVMMIRGIYKDWKIPISYYLTRNSVNAETLIKIIKSALNSLNDIGFQPMVIVCDQSTTNQRTMKLLQVSHDIPFFIEGNHTYYCVFDAPHLIKSLRSNLMTGNFCVNDDIIDY